MEELGVTAAFLPLSVPYPGLSVGGMLSGRGCLSAGLRRLLPFRAIPFVSYLVEEEKRAPRDSLT